MPQGEARIAAVRAVVAALRAIFGEGFDVNAQLPLPLDDHSEPEPDVLVLRGSWRDYDGRDPDLREDVVLAVEVSDSSLNRDQGLKARLYAACGVPEYGIVDLRHRTLAVRGGLMPRGTARRSCCAKGESAAGRWRWPTCCRGRQPDGASSLPLGTFGRVRLEGKVVLVTGSTTGIGEGIARRAAGEGASVVVHGQEDDPRIPGSFLVRGDLEDPEVPERLIAAVLERFGRLDGLVNNAGVSWRAPAGAGAEFFDRVMAINARAPFLMVRAARPHLKGGSVVNIGSANAHATGEELLPYGMSKAALENLTRTLSGPLARSRTRINALSLGWTLTPGERKLLSESYGWEEDWPEKRGAGMPLGRLILPEDVAGVVCYLLSDEAAMVTGQIWGFDQHAH